jgi:hypothetical protein
LKGWNSLGRLLGEEVQAVIQSKVKRRGVGSRGWVGACPPCRPGAGAEMEPSQADTRAQCANTHASIYKVHLLEHLLVFSPDKGKQFQT